MTVSWTGANQIGAPLLGDWIDAVYLSKDDQWDINDIRLATVPHTGGLAENQTYSGSTTVPVPGVLPGNYPHPRPRRCRQPGTGDERGRQRDRHRGRLPWGPASWQATAPPSMVRSRRTTSPITTCSISTPETACGSVDQRDSRDSHRALRPLCGVPKPAEIRPALRDSRRHSRRSR